MLHLSTRVHSSLGWCPPLPSARVCVEVMPPARAPLLSRPVENEIKKLINEGTQRVRDGAREAMNYCLDGQMKVLRELGHVHCDVVQKLDEYMKNVQGELQHMKKVHINSAFAMIMQEYKKKLDEFKEVQKNKLEKFKKQVEKNVQKTIKKKDREIQRLKKAKRQTDIQMNNKLRRMQESVTRCLFRMTKVENIVYNDQKKSKSDAAMIRVYLKMKKPKGTFPKQRKFSFLSVPTNCTMKCLKTLISRKYMLTDESQIIFQDPKIAGRHHITIKDLMEPDASAVHLSLAYSK